MEPDRYPGKGFRQKNGVEIINLSSQEAARWKEAAEAVVENYVKDMVGKGYSASEVRGWIKFLRERIHYWTVKQIASHITSATGPDEMR